MAVAGASAGGRGAALPQVAVAVAAAVAGAGASAGVSAALAGTALATTLGATGTAIVAGVAGAAASLAVGFVGQAIVGKPKIKKPKTSQLERGLQVMIRGAVEPEQWIFGQTRVGGQLVLAETTGNTNEYLHLVVSLADRQCAAVLKMWLGEDEIDLTSQVDTSGQVTSGPYAGHVRARVHLGDPGQPADAALVSECPSWTGAHVGFGICYVYLRLKYSDKVFPSGLPELSFLARGCNVPDPRNGSRQWTPNAVLVIHDVLREYLGAGDDEISAPSFSAAATICDELVDLDGGDSERRYEAHGVVRLDDSTDALTLVDELLQQCQGLLSYEGGRYHIHPAAWAPPVLHFDERDLAGDQPLTVEPALPVGDAFHAVTGRYQAAEDRYRGGTWPRFAMPIYDDGLALKDGTLDLPWETSATRAQRLGKLLVERANNALSGTVRLKRRALQVAVGERITLTMHHLGWIAKVFLVTGWTWGLGESVALTIQEDAPEFHAWAVDEATAYDAAPNTFLPTLRELPPPTAVNATPIVYQTQPALFRRAGIDVDWTASASAYAASYEVQARTGGVSPGAWEAAPATTETSARIRDLAAGTYDVRVRAASILGIRSDWVEIRDVIIAGDEIAPSPPTGLVVEAGLLVLNLSWDLPSGDVREIIVYENNENNRNEAVEIARIAATSYPRRLVAGARRWYWIKAVDFSGNMSGFNDVSGVDGVALRGNLLIREERSQFLGDHFHAPAWETIVEVSFEAPGEGQAIVYEASLQVRGNDTSATTDHYVQIRWIYNGVIVVNETPITFSNTDTPYYSVAWASSPIFVSTRAGLNTIRAAMLCRRNDGNRLNRNYQGVARNIVASVHVLN